MPIPRMNLRIGVVQLSPKIGQVQANLAKARELCRKIQPQSLDLLCFPEMALTGYVFDNATSIAPHLEQPRTGITSQFCSELSKKLQCYVVAGYPERLGPEEVADVTFSEDGDDTVQQVGANSAAFYGPDGEWVGGYRKTNLYETDMTWAKPGDGFTTFTLSPPLQHVMSLAICMDLNSQTPHWSLPDGPYELADYCVSKKTKLLILLNAWLDSEKELEETKDWNTLNYWASRLRPLWSNGTDDDSSEEDGDTSQQSDSQNPGHETVVVICNRSGQENGKTFAGTSAIFSMRQGSGRPVLLDMMERTEEGVRIWNIQI
ncbi:hydrolase [Crassisporium funariophilum]|nr:hydrolase [Crassisporium funariophilum]